jgi:ABC-type lipoprotein release transport system permease subunit
MQSKINLLFLLINTHKQRNIGIFLISTLLVTLLSSVLFISSSIQEELLQTLDSQADFTLQKYEAGKLLNTPASWIDEFLAFEGVTNVQGRVYGIHYYEPKETYFMIVGIDMYEEQIAKDLQKLVDGLDIDRFLDHKSMLIGAGVKKFFDEYAYNKYYTFRPPNRSKEKVYIYDVLPKESALLSNDMILMEISQARTILGMKKDQFTDITLQVKNQEEMQKIEEKLIISHFNMRIIKKSDIEKFYTNLFNYKGGLFLSLFIISLLTFSIILYQRYSIVVKMEAKEIALLRMMGWKIKEIISLKIMENFFLVSTSYMLGILFAYIFVFILNAPLLKNIFLGFKNLNNEVSFVFYPSFETLALLFIIFVIPFILATLIPLYKISITDISKVIK